MINRARREFVRLLPGLMLGALACQHRPPSPLVGDDALVRGIVSVTGTEFAQALMLRAERGLLRLSMTTADFAALVRLAGMQVAVRGSGDAHSLRVASFIALRAGDQPVVDGVLRRDGSSLALDTAEGRVPLGNPPHALQQLIGARVWISGPAATGPNSFGVIIPPS